MSATWCPYSTPLFSHVLYQLSYLAGCYEEAE